MHEFKKDNSYTDNDLNKALEILTDLKRKKSDLQFQEREASEELMRILIKEEKYDCLKIDYSRLRMLKK